MEEEALIIYQTLLPFCKTSYVIVLIQTFKDKKHNQEEAFVVLLGEEQHLRLQVDRSEMEQMQHLQQEDNVWAVIVVVDFDHGFHLAEVEMQANLLLVQDVQVEQGNQDQIEMQCLRPQKQDYVLYVITVSQVEIKLPVLPHLKLQIAQKQELELLLKIRHLQHQREAHFQEAKQLVLQLDRKLVRKRFDVQQLEGQQSLMKIKKQLVEVADGSLKFVELLWEEMMIKQIETMMM